MDHPLHLAYVATAPTPAANLFDLVVSASSIFGGLWEGGAGAIAAENQALAWLADLAGFPDGAGGCFVTGGSAANLSALVTARHRARKQLGDPPGGRWRFVTTGETHASVHAAAQVMDVDVVLVPPDERDRMTGDALRATLAETGNDGVFAVVANCGTTNAGAIDELDAAADVCAEHGCGCTSTAPTAAPRCARRRRPPPGAASTGPTASASIRTSGCSRRTTAPRSCTAIRPWRRPPTPSTARTSTWSAGRSGTRATSPSTCPAGPAACRCGSAWRPTAPTPTRRPSRRRSTWPAASPARSTGATVSRCCSSPSCRSCCSASTAGTTPATRHGASRAKAGVTLIVPTRWQGERCYRVCLVNPLTTEEMLPSFLDDMQGF